MAHSCLLPHIKGVMGGCFLGIFKLISNDSVTEFSIISLTFFTYLEMFQFWQSLHKSCFFAAKTGGAELEVNRTAGMHAFWL